MFIVHIRSQIRIRIFIQDLDFYPGSGSRVKTPDSGSGSTTLAQSSQEAIFSARDENTSVADPVSF
jgi:hypothetical protein